MPMILNDMPAIASKAAVVAANKPKAKPAPPQHAASAPAPYRHKGPYGAVLNSIDTDARASSDIARRRLDDNRAYQAWQLKQQGGRAQQAVIADTQAAGRNAFVQSATTAAQKQTQTTLDQQRGARQNSVTGGPGNSRSALAGDDTLTQSLLSAAQQRQNAGAVSSQAKAGFLAAAVAAAGNADAARIRGENYQERRALGGEKRDVLARRASDNAASKDAALKAQSDADMLAQRLSVQSEGIQARAASSAASNETSMRNADVAAETSRGNAKAARIQRSTLAKASGKGGGVSPSETRARVKDARSLSANYDTIKTTAAGLKAEGVPYSKVKARLAENLSVLHPNLQVDPDALNAALSAIYDPKAKGGKPRGKALTNYTRALKNRRLGKG